MDSTHIQQSYDILHMINMVISLGESGTKSPLPLLTPKGREVGFKTYHSLFGNQQGDPQGGGGSG